MTLDASYQFDKSDQIFVKIANATVYKTTILDRRSRQYNTCGFTYTIKEYQIKNTSQDSPTICWVNEDRCFSIHDTDKILQLDI